MKTHSRVDANGQVLWVVSNGYFYSLFSSYSGFYSHKCAIGSINDSPELTPDRMGSNNFCLTFCIKWYRAGLSKIVRKFDTPKASLCVALLGPWGSGKTFFMEFSKGQFGNKIHRWDSKKVGKRSGRKTLKREKTLLRSIVKRNC